MKATARLVTCCAVLLIACPVRAQLEGTLFTQPEEREYLDYLRQEYQRTNAEGGFDIEVVEIPDIPEGEVAVVETGPVEVSFGGIMTRRDGSHSIWLNGRLLREDELPAGITLVEASRNHALRIAQDTNVFVLLPGQTANLTTGAIIENSPPPAPETVPAEDVSAPESAVPEPVVPEPAGAEPDSQATPVTPATAATNTGNAAPAGSIEALADSLMQLSEEEQSVLANTLDRKEEELLNDP